MTSPNFGPINAQAAYVPLSNPLPLDGDKLRISLEEMYKRLGSAVNCRDIAIYNTVESITGQQFFPFQGNAKYRQTYRKVIDFGQLPTSSTKNVAHGIPVNSGTVFTRVYGTANRPGVSSIPLPYVKVTAPADGVQLEVDATNVKITTTTANYASYSGCLVVLEYIKN